VRKLCDRSYLHDTQLTRATTFTLAHDHISMESTSIDEPKCAVERTRGAEISTENIVGTVNSDAAGASGSTGYSYDHYGKAGSDYKVRADPPPPRDC
jgi:hypothetical protein